MKRTKTVYMFPPKSRLLNEVIAIFDMYKCHFVCPACIVDVEAEGDYVNVYDREGNKKIFCMTLKELMKFLAPTGAFCRVGRSNTVNIYEAGTQDTGSEVLKMSNGRSITVSERGNTRFWSMFVKLETHDLQYVIPFAP